MKKGRLLITSLLVAAITASSSCTLDPPEDGEKRINPESEQMVYAPELDPGVHELITNHRYKSLDNKEALRFETAVTPEEASNGTPVELLDSSGKTISKMFDDGTHMDRIAGDGIYTCSYKPNPKIEASFSYTARIGNISTEPASVRYFDKITTQDVKDMGDVSRSLAVIQSAYTDSEGYIPDDKKADALTEAGEYVKELYNNGAVLEYRVNQQYNNIVMKLNSGFTLVYSTPGREDLDSGSAQSPNTPDYAVKKLTLKGYRPFADYDNDDYSYKIGEVLERCFRKITGTPDFHNCIIDKDVDKGKKVSPQSVMDFGRDQVIFWASHGGFDGVVHSFLCTVEELHAENYDDDPNNDINDGAPRYTDDDIFEDRIILQACTGDNLDDLIRDSIDPTKPEIPTGPSFLSYRQNMSDPYECESYIRQLGSTQPTDSTMTPGDYLTPGVVYHPCITAEYISAHCGDMTNSFVFLSACSPLKDSVLAASFINKNCNVVVGFDDTVHIDFAEQTITTLVDYMCTPSTRPSGTPSDYQPVSKFLDSWGTDYHAATNRRPAFKTRLIAFGNKDYKFAEAIADDLFNAREDAEIRLGYLSLEATYINVDYRKPRKVEITSYPDGYGPEDIIWTTDDEDIAVINKDGIVIGIQEGGSTRISAVTKDGLYTQKCFIHVRKE
ncbi:Ig-like domain-containing protein [Ruminococcus flavefaciens]|uniref:BIG2 domain-containing protein n=1 Tax=Ruminococcus flavefaciens 007c TaxID=1341157 RepID=W7UUY6_RUMFL|nr:choice-of-anchor X domain-containing protein [Ruminococcus flavefaciens]EWM54984.1 hypothetical protein RF007C_03035 [Ruminococcus flavefaciens 007c]